MKKSKLIAAVLALVLAFSGIFMLASCDKDGGADTTAAPVQSSAETTAPVFTPPTEPATDAEFVPNVTAPSAPAVEVTEALTRVNEYATNPDTGSYVTEISNVEFVYPEYFAQGNSYVAIRNIEIEDMGFTHNADAYVDFEVLARGDGEDEKVVKVSYIGYDAEGGITRRSQITVNLYGHEVGEIIEDCRMDFKRETAKIVFTEFKEITE